MIQDSQPLASRGRRTIILALSVFILAGLIAVVNRSRSDDHASRKVLADSESSSPSVATVPAAPALAVQPPIDHPDSLASTGYHRTIAANGNDLSQKSETPFPSRARSSFASPSATVDSLRNARSNDRIAAADLARGAQRSIIGPFIAVLILGLGTAVAVWLKRTRRSGSASTAIESIARLQLSQNHEVRLIRVRGEEILLASTQTSLTVLHKFGLVPEALGQQSEQGSPVSLDTINHDGEQTTISGNRDPLTDPAPSAPKHTNPRDVISIDHPSGPSPPRRNTGRRSFESHLRSSSDEPGNVVTKPPVADRSGRSSESVNSGLAGLASNPADNDEVSHG